MKFCQYISRKQPTADNTAYTLRAVALVLRDIASFGRNVVYAGNVIRNNEGGLVCGSKKKQYPSKNEVIINEI